MFSPLMRPSGAPFFRPSIPQTGQFFSVLADQQPFARGRVHALNFAHTKNQHEQFKPKSDGKTRAEFGGSFHIFVLQKRMVRGQFCAGRLRHVLYALFFCRRSGMAVGQVRHPHHFRHQLKNFRGRTGGFEKTAPLHESGFSRLLITGARHKKVDKPLLKIRFKIFPAPQRLAAKHRAVLHQAVIPPVFGRLIHLRRMFAFRHCIFSLFGFKQTQKPPQKTAANSPPSPRA
ncbi:MAG: hypothetical protein MPK13_03445, partial [Gammaproteobacteria bacterium]|nr:hypothetical protein [Gammaproteobacteria bacterium]